MTTPTLTTPEAAPETAGVHEQTTAVSGPAPVPVSASLLGHIFDDLLVRIDYDDGTTVRVRRRPGGLWLCSEHGRRTRCRHVEAARLTWSAHHALTSPTPDPTP